MSRKKIILFIVEGITDKTSLELALQNLFEGENRVVFEVVKGDITTSNRTNSKNIRSKLTTLVKSNGQRKYEASDYKEVIHIVDTDGAFLKSKYIFFDEKYRHFHYTEDGIFCRNIEKVEERNRQKAEMLNVLLHTDTVYTNVPYRVFYFSCNLEHVLHDRINLPDDDKTRYAEKFEEKYADDAQKFLHFMCNSEFSFQGDYHSSWKFIKLENNSVKRYSNFNLFLKEYYSEIK